MKTTHFRGREIPNKYLIQSLKQSEEDVKAGRVISFPTGKDALAYLKSLMKHDRKKP